MKQLICTTYPIILPRDTAHFVSDRAILSPVLSGNLVNGRVVRNRGDDLHGV